MVLTIKRTTHYTVQYKDYTIITSYRVHSTRASGIPVFTRCAIQQIWGVQQIGSSGNEEFTRWGVEEMKSSGDGMLRSWGVYEMGSSRGGEFRKWGFQQKVISRDGEFRS